MYEFCSPKHIQIETVFGVCTANCTMCIISKVRQSPQFMDTDLFANLLYRLKTIKNQEFLTLSGLGEPLLDKEIHQKIIIAKNLNYKGIGFPSNCTELNEDTSIKLLDAKLDTLICSIDGINKETHENIRRGTSYTKILNNVLNFINLRDNNNYKTRILIRFIRQESNYTEWDDYKAFWNSKLNKKYGDSVLRFDVHNWGGQLTKKANQNSTNPDITDKMIICDDLINRLIIKADGKISFCCGDFADKFNLGNVFEDDALKLYNSGYFIQYRQAMVKGTLFKMEPCSSCSMIINRKTRILPV